MYQILLVEDSVESQKLVQHLLQPIAEVVAVGSVDEALRIFKKDKFDLILMDVVLEDGDGFELTREIRKLSYGRDIPIIFITAQGDIQDKTIGFNLGAEDYIVKPFDTRELILRLKTRLQKLERSKKRDIVEIGNLKLDIPLQKAMLINEQTDLDLTPIQFKILIFLLNQEGEVVRRENLITAIWGENFQMSRSVDTHINAIRKKLGRYSNYIESIYGVGFKVNISDS